jgi:hypothetical protein
MKRSKFQIKRMVKPRMHTDKYKTRSNDIVETGFVHNNYFKYLDLTNPYSQQVALSPLPYRSAT